MRPLLALSIAIATLIGPVPSIASTFNLRASLENGYFVSGTVSIDPTSGLVTGESSTLYRYGVPLSTFGTPGSQGIFAPGGTVAPSYLFSSAGSNGYLFVGALATPSPIGYTGGELCSLLSTVRCAYSDVFLGGVDIANAVQGVLLPVSDTIRTFTLTATFENGDNLQGTVVIDTTAGFVLDERATLYSHGVVVDDFYAPQSQALFAPGGGITPSYLVPSFGAAGVLFNLGVPGTSLVGYLGGDLCATGNGLTCAYSDIFVTPTTAYNATAARLVLQRSVPEPSVAALVACGVLALGWRRRPVRASSRRGPGVATSRS